VLEGTVIVMVEGERYTVNWGDSLLFEADVEHLIFTEDRPATFAIVSSPPYGQKVI
jgi:quercetin dioxygenase-like cupin family protein